MDLMLDVAVDLDFSGRLKDEEEFEEIVQRGIFDESLGQRVRDEARVVIDRVASVQPPFSEPWSPWRPDSTWKIPVLIDGWDSPSS
jgi:hypothetical protein